MYAWKRNDFSQEANCAKRKCEWKWTKKQEQQETEQRDPQSVKNSLTLPRLACIGEENGQPESEGGFWRLGSDLRRCRLGWPDERIARDRALLCYVARSTSYLKKLIAGHQSLLLRSHASWGGTNFRRGAPIPDPVSCSKFPVCCSQQFSRALWLRITFACNG